MRYILSLHCSGAREKASNSGGNMLGTLTAKEVLSADQRRREGAQCAARNLPDGMRA